MEMEVSSVIGARHEPGEIDAWEDTEAKLCGTMSVIYRTLLHINVA